MILDQTVLLSDEQAIVATAASTDYLDLGATGTPKLRNATALIRNISKGEPIPFLVQITEAFNTLTSLTVAIQTDDNTSFSSPTTVYSESIVLASLTLGARINIDVLPKNVKERYMRMYYTVVGTAPTLGKVTAGVSMGNSQTMSE
jgi:hypothetical protein